MKVRSGFVSNSSSSSFVCDTTIDIEKATEYLKEILKFYNKFFNKKLKFSEVFRTPFKADKKYTDDMKNNWQYNCPKGSLIIESAEDNSIPYALFEIICEKFNAFRNHLG